MAVTSIEPPLGEGCRCSCTVGSVNEGSKCLQLDCVVSCKSNGNGHDTGASGGFDQTNDLVGAGVSHAGVAPWLVDHHGAVLLNAVGAPRLFPLVYFLGGDFLRAGSPGARALLRARYRGRGSRCLQSAEGHVSFRIFGREGAIGCAAVENCRRTSPVLGPVPAPYRNENSALVCGVGDRSRSLQFPSPGMEGAPSV